MGTFLAAVGVPVGQAPLSAPTAGTVLLLRIGSRWVALDQRSAGLWRSALVPTSRARLEELEGGADDVAELVSAGVLVPCWDDDACAPEFLDLIPICLSVGTGQDSAGDDLAVVRDWRGEELVRLDRIDYLIWTHLNGRTTIAQALRATAVDLRSESSAVERIPGLFTALLRSRAIALDAA